MIQLILDHPGFDFYPALFDVDLQNAVHVARHVDHDAGIERLAVGAGAAAARAEGQRLESLIPGQAGDQRHVGGGTGEHHRIGQQLIDAVVGGHRQPVSVAGGGVAVESVLLQCFQKVEHPLNEAGRLRNLWDHSLF